MKRIAAFLTLVAASCSSHELGPCDDHSRLKFDRAAWLANNDQFGMIDDLVRNSLPVGTSREAVMELLGKPNLISATFVNYDVGCMHNFDLFFDERGLLVRTVLELY
jgi:outer membrane protein assembly factor BamE (lipoprotein component of BamABCDE complex)